jgi:hypothetical protein
MKYLNIFKKQPKEEQNGSFANFFLYASEKEKMKVFKDAAKRSNEDQRKLVEDINKLKPKTT